ncbi:FGGY-family carbohydrate kinase [Deinococcus detaillensis]|uniref:FGGY-family carbohydrate kinase n=1 Tax=Deinococcus detaillensis TaxID=2592048 RepID=UPI001CDCBDB6|nr:FGGY-family carbohydrate kinase [Deinococcus detaillensis]
MTQFKQAPDRPLANLLLGIDVGTYSSKGVLTDLAGNVLKSLVIAHGVSFPQTGYAEQDADLVWWSDVSQIIKTLLSGDYSGDDVAGVALSAIGPCLLPLDESGRPLRPGILYGVDTRAHAEIDLLNAEIGGDVIFEHSLMALTSQAVGSKIRWLRDHEPEVWAKTATLTTASSYLAFRLTGKHVMNRHEASHYMPLYDPPTRNWTSKYAAPVLGDKGLEVLPQVSWSDELAGHVTEEAAALTGLKVGTPVAVGAVDALSEAISVGVVQPGDLMVMYGSTTFFILVEEAPAPDPRVWTVGGAFAGQFNLAAGMSTTGSLTRWFADELSRDLSEKDAYDELFAAAEGVPAGANGLLMLPYFSGERTPLNDPHARGVVAGLSLSSTREDLFRAVLEGVGYGIRHNIETFREMGTQVRRIVAVGGGAKTQTWLQIVSDIVGAAQEVPALTIGASYGDAFLAGLVSGRLHRDDLKTWVKADRLIQPDESKRALYDKKFELFKQLYTQTKGIVHQLS